MLQSTDTSAFPLSPVLTARVVHYLNGFRLFIALALVAAWYGGFLLQGHLITHPAAPAILLGFYTLAAAVLIVLARRPGTNHYHLALGSMLVDLVTLSLMLSTFGGLDSGLGVLLVFVSAGAAILLPLRLALFVAALATLAIIGEAVVGGYLVPQARPHLLRSGLYGLTLFVTTALIHALAVWLRDFRLIAERQAMTLSRLEQINELIIRRMRSGVLAIDRAGDIRLMNESAWYLLGGPPSDDRKLADLAPELQQRLDAWLADPRTEAASLRLAGSQADIIPQFVALPAGLEIAALVFMEDSDVISRRALEFSAHSLAKLSSGIAHEIRNPLSAIRHAAQLLVESESLDEGDARLAGIIEQQSLRMNRIVENILQLSRRETSRPEVLDLQPWLEETAAEFRSAHPQPTLELRLPGTRGSALVVFDRSQLHQVLWKLLENAVRHSPHAPSEVVIELDCRIDEPTEGFCLLSVRDNGAGIAADRIGEIFEAFYTTHQEGSGLGLYIARQLCEANQAALTVDSAPGRYTRFQIRMARATGAPGSVEPQ